MICIVKSLLHLEWIKHIIYSIVTAVSEAQFAWLKEIIIEAPLLLLITLLQLLLLTQQTDKDCAREKNLNWCLLLTLKDMRSIMSTRGQPKHELNANMTTDNLFIIFSAHHQSQTRQCIKRNQTWTLFMHLKLT